MADIPASNWKTAPLPRQRFGDRTLKKGDLVSYTSFGNVIFAVIVGFDEDNDLYVRCIATGEQDNVWRGQVEVLNESR